MPQDRKFFIVSEDYSGVELVKWFRKNNVGLPHGLVQKLIRKKAILVNDEKASKEQILNAGDKISIPDKVKPVKKAPTKKKEKYIVTEADAEKHIIPNIIFMDKNIIAINKPQGIATQGGSGVTISIDDMLKFLSFDIDSKPMLAHRLDKDTSGLLLLARTKKSAAILGKGFKEGLLKKKYLAVVAGVVEPQKGRISYPLAPRRSAGGSEKMEVDNHNGKIAVTVYKTLKVLDGGKASLLQVEPQTGRKHQIRAHLSHIGNPIIGDGKYGGSNSFIEGYGKNLHLHSWKISHTEKFFQDEIEAEPPEYFLY